MGSVLIRLILAIVALTTLPLLVLHYSHPFKSIFLQTHQPKRRDLVLWSSDFHIGPIADIRHILQAMPTPVKVIDQSLSSHCHLTNTCQTDLRILNQENGITLGWCPNRLRRQFYRYYRSNELFLSVDAVLCTYAFASCVDLFLPFQKTIIVIFTTRFETGRHDFDSWSRWIETLRRVASNPNNVIAANNMYDLEYVKYFTGIKDVMLLPSYCGYTNAKYHPTRNEILIGPGRGLHQVLVNDLIAAGNRSNIIFSPIRDLYPKYEYSDLASHPAMVLFPYQVSIMTIFELYRMEIPLFVPSPELLVDWHKQFNILSERTWPGVFNRPVQYSVVPKHPNCSSAIKGHDPNDDFNRDAILSWIRLSDFYQWPNVSTFNDWDDLIAQIQRSDLESISSAMAAFNKIEIASIKNKWDGILRLIENHREVVNRARYDLPKSLNEALRITYGMQLRRSDCHEVEFRNIP